jgi:hypothetical protein
MIEISVVVTRSRCGCGRTRATASVVMPTRVAGACRIGFALRLIRRSRRKIAGRAEERLKKERAGTLVGARLVKGGLDVYGQCSTRAA